MHYFLNKTIIGSDNELKFMIQIIYLETFRNVKLMFFVIAKFTDFSNNPEML